MSLISEESKYIIQTYKRFNLVLTRGRGKYVWDDKGKKYLDFFSGISVCNLGHCNPGVVRAITRQSKKLLHASNHYYTAPQVWLARELVRRTFPGKVFFSNSGAEANECAIKLARKWGHEKGKYEIIVFRNSFHGRTMATLTATGQEKFHKGFEPLLPGFRYAEYNDRASVKKLVGRKTAAIMLEPVLGEGGVYPATREFLKGLRLLCDKHGLLLIFDEVQSGLGRTGALYAFQNYGVSPDVVTLGKSLGGGLPIGATIAREKAAAVFGYGDHGSTFGGNLVPCAAATEVLSQLTPAVLKKVTENGKYFLSTLKELASRYAPLVKEVRGMGLMVGLELDSPCRDIVEFCQNKGLLINCTQNTIVRALPPLIIERKDIDTALQILEDALQWKKSKKSS